MGNLWTFPYERHRREIQADRVNRAYFIQVNWKGMTPSEAKEAMEKLFRKNILYVFDKAYARNYTIPPRRTNFVTFLTVEDIVQGWLWEADHFYSRNVD